MSDILTDLRALVANLRKNFGVQWQTLADALDLLIAKYEKPADPPSVGER